MLHRPTRLLLELLSGLRYSFCAPFCMCTWQWQWPCPPKGCAPPGKLSSAKYFFFFFFSLFCLTLIVSSPSHTVGCHCHSGLVVFLGHIILRSLESLPRRGRSVCVCVFVYVYSMPSNTTRSRVNSGALLCMQAKKNKTLVKSCSRFLYTFCASLSEAEVVRGGCIL